MSDDQDQLIRKNQPEFSGQFPDGKCPADSTLLRWIKAGTFPPPDVELSRRYKAWWGSTLQRWRRGEWRGSRP